MPVKQCLGNLFFIKENLNNEVIYWSQFGGPTIHVDVRIEVIFTTPYLAASLELRNAHCLLGMAGTKNSAIKIFVTNLWFKFYMAAWLITLFFFIVYIFNPFIAVMSVSV